MSLFKYTNLGIRRMSKPRNRVQLVAVCVGCFVLGGLVTVIAC